METLDLIKKRLILMGFSLKDGSTTPIYSKSYKKCNNSEICIELDEENYKNSNIKLPDELKADRKTTQNLSQKETFVVIECLNRLLENGYPPSEITLEKAYPSGHKEKGQFLDILVTKDGRPFYMIECKQWGEAYKTELKNLEENGGGQLFTYYTNDREVKAICLYCSTIIDNRIEPKYKIIDTSEFNGSNRFDIYNQWNRDYAKFDIFEAVYDTNTKGKKWENLSNISEDKALYNEFAKILRKYAVSDLTNAYNKLFNLFLCKIVDEDKAILDNQYELQFQWKNNDTNFDVLDRLSNLYKEGISQYLGIQVTDYSFDRIRKHIEDISGGDSIIGKELEKEFKEIRFIKNNEFSFIEVFNEETFKQNSLILKEVVKLFEDIKIKYSDKHQILGDFFERLLNIGIKQTEGQFFTPIPIANFIVNSIPFEKIINSKISEGEHNIFPYMIDYACGAGHFLTEYMHRIQKIIDDGKMDIPFKSQSQEKAYERWANENDKYAWAREFVYGIEKDYRLTKTSKIACFMNGDGDANIITANGLDSFDSEAYKNFKQLYCSFNDYVRDNSKFDCVIANPPYSVDDFIETLKTTDGESYVEKNFELYNALGENSDDIECLFVERTKQLLKTGAIGAIILSDKFLTNLTKIHKKTREFLIENFKIRSIVELGEGAFASTDTNTVVLFIERRIDEEKVKLKNILLNFKNNCVDFNYKNKQNVVDLFLKDVYDDIEFDDYISLLNEEPSQNLKNSELYKEFKLKHDKKIKKNKNNKENPLDFSELINLELKKLYIYLLNMDEKLIVSIPGNTKEEIRNYLGYKITKRRGNEGLKEIKDLSDAMVTELNNLTDKTCFNSMLCNPSDLHDNTKINHYIYQFMKNGYLNKDEVDKLDKNFGKKVLYKEVNELLDFDELEFNLSIDIHKEEIETLPSKYPKVRLSTIIESINGIITVKKEDLLKEGKYPAISQDSEKISGYTNIEPNIYDFPIILFGDHNCRLKYVDYPFVRAGDGAKIFKIIENNILPKYVYYIIDGLIKPQGYKRHTKILRNIKIPIPINCKGEYDIDIQKEIVDKLSKIDNDKYTDAETKSGKKLLLKEEILKQYL